MTKDPVSEAVSFALDQMIEHARKQGPKALRRDDCTSAGYDGNGVIWLVEGTAEEIREESKRAGYKVLDSENSNDVE